ncbi:hypothetical protein BHUM_01303 [Candidatus Burkholderia humilis]|nr:hypothetical protein BHUM_01303 [Candidatus Burkholderia humilis]
MSVRDVGVIDYVGIDVIYRRVHVGIFDELDWHDEERHLDLLTRKVDRCIRHIRLGQLLLNYPQVRGYEIAIEYVSTHPITRAAREFWESRERLIRAAGYDVRMRGVDVRPSCGIEVETPAEPEPVAVEVLDAEPLRFMPTPAEVSYLPPQKPFHRRAAGARETDCASRGDVTRSRLFCSCKAKRRSSSSFAAFFSYRAITACRSTPNSRPTAPKCRWSSRTARLA